MRRQRDVQFDEKCREAEQAGADDEALAALSLEEKRRCPLVIQRGQDVRWKNLLGVADGVIEAQPDLLILLAFGSQAQRL